MTAKAIAEALSGERFGIEEVRDIKGDVSGLCIYAQWPYADEINKLVRDFMIVNGARISREAIAKLRTERERDAAEQGFEAAKLRKIAETAFEGATSTEGKPS